MTVFAGASLRRLGVHLHLRRVRGDPGPHHVLRHRVADQQCCHHLQVLLPLPFISNFISNYKESEELFYSTH